MYEAKTSGKKKEVLFQGKLRVTSVGVGEWSSQQHANLVEPFAEVYASYIRAMCQAELIDKHTLVSMANEADKVAEEARDWIYNAVRNTDNMLSQYRSS
ncbi:hypothetical protein RvY_15072 [Ramazzottius varieornatus]|uniref:Uncharacterized protein n=1 Tax=Ramazzottius varieornatus TaxID=947166 RepID=A0A1D1VTL1_RAMVA|nr:hypothetical protein RvY_15072 [Ramazzottius varieornatus]